MGSDRTIRNGWITIGIGVAFFVFMGIMNALSESTTFTSPFGLIAIVVGVVLIAVGYYRRSKEQK